MVSYINRGITTVFITLRCENITAPFCSLSLARNRLDLRDLTTIFQNKLKKNRLFKGNSPCLLEADECTNLFDEQDKVLQTGMI